VLTRKSILAAFAATIAIVAVPFAAQAQDKSITVFAAASMKNALDDVNAAFTKQSGVKVVASYDASSALMKQIEGGAPADVFVSADLKWMDYGSQKKLIKDDTRVNLLGNTLVLIAPKDSKIDKVTIAPGFDLAKLAGDGRIATGDVKAVPAGIYAQAALEKLGVWSSVEPKMAMTANVRAALVLVATVGGGWLLDRYLSSTMYPEGTRNLSAQMASTLHSVQGAINVFEMAAGQVWRLVLDSWGLGGIGLFAAIAVVVRPRFRADLRIMAALAVAVTVLIACIAPAALPADQSQTWASGRYLDGMIVTFFLVGAAVLLRASTSRILRYAAWVAGLTVLTAVTVAIYAGTSLPTAGFGGAFNFAEPAVLTQDWTQASVLVATAVAFGLLACWIVLALVVRRWRGLMQACGLGVLGLAVAAVSLVAVAQMTSHVSRPGTSAQAASTTGLVTAARLGPGDQVAVSTAIPWELWIPQAFEISWTELQFFNPSSQPPPAGVNVVETLWPNGSSASASWPHAPAGWRVVAANRPAGWVIWRHA